MKYLLNVVFYIIDLQTPLVVNAKTFTCYQRCKTDPPQRLKIDPGVNLLL